MKTQKNKIITISIALLLMLSMAASMILTPSTLAQVYFPPGYQVPTYAFINVAPNPIGVGQTVNVNFFLSSVIETSEFAQNMIVTDNRSHRHNYDEGTLRKRCDWRHILQFRSRQSWQLHIPILLWRTNNNRNQLHEGWLW